MELLNVEPALAMALTKPVGDHLAVGVAARTFGSRPKMLVRCSFMCPPIESLAEEHHGGNTPSYRRPASGCPGSVGASAHRHGGAHDCWWASSCAAPNHLDAGAFVLLALGPLALLFRRRHPRAVLAFVFLVTLVYVALGYQQGPNYASLIVALVAVVVSGDRLVAGIALVTG